MEVAVGNGAEDYALEGDEWSVTTPAEALSTVLDALEAAKIAAKGSIAYLPKNKKPIEGRDAEVALNLAEALDDHDDVQNVYSDFDISDEEMGRIAKDS
jgi:transcriptional/translational regulatory protein YebC/TACO1